MKKLYVALCIILLLLVLLYLHGNVPTNEKTVHEATTEDDFYEAEDNNGVTPVEAVNPIVAPPVFELESLPDIGEYNHKSEAELFNRKAHERMTEFVPSDDYGCIVPFLGRFSDCYYVPTDGLWNMADVGDKSKEAFFGICTTDGIVITDAVYNDVEELRDEFGNAYFCFYRDRVETEEGERLVKVTEYYPSVTVIPQDGSWAVEVPYADCRCTHISQERIVTRTWSGTGASIADFEGNILFSKSEGTSENLRYIDISKYRNGYAKVETVVGESYDNRQNRIFYVDLYGNEVSDNIPTNEQNKKSEGTEVANKTESSPIAKNTYVTETYYDDNGVRWSKMLDTKTGECILDAALVNVFYVNAVGKHFYTYTDGTYCYLSTLSDGEFTHLIKVKNHNTD